MASEILPTERISRRDTFGVPEEQTVSLSRRSGDDQYFKERKDNVENNALKGVLRPEGSLSEAERAIWKIFEEKEAYQKSRVKKNDLASMQHFVPFYGDETIKRDESNITLKMSDPQWQAGLRRGTLLERILFEAVDLHNLFGQEAESWESSLFDDLFNGTDFVISWPASQSKKDILGPVLTVDCGLISQSQESLSALNVKLEKLIHKTRTGKLTRVKYPCFCPDLDLTRENFIQKFIQVPKVVLGVSAAHLKELSQDYLPTLQNIKGANQKFAKSLWPLLFLEQAKTQLDFQEKILQEIIHQKNRVNSEHIEASRKVRTILNQIEKAAEAKKRNLDLSTQKKLKNILRKDPLIWAVRNKYNQHFA